MSGSPRCNCVVVVYKTESVLRMSRLTGLCSPIIWFFYFPISLQWTPRYHYRLRRQARHLSNGPRHSLITSIITAAVIIRKRPAVCSPVVSANHLNSTGLSCMDCSAERTYLRRPITVGATVRLAQVSLNQQKRPPQRRELLHQHPTINSVRTHPLHIAS